MGTSITNIDSASRPDQVAITASDMYTIVISVEDQDGGIFSAGTSNVFPLRANLPERFHLQMSSDWSAPFAETSLADLAGQGIDKVTGRSGSSAVLNGLSQLTGTSTRIQDQFIQVWQSSSALSFNVDLVFYAQESTEKEIRQRHLAMLKLVAPTSVSGVLSGPGPKIVGGLTSGRKISVNIGQYLYFDSVIVRDVSTDVVTLMDENGIPIGMTFNVAFETWNSCVTTDDLDKIFRY